MPLLTREIIPYTAVNTYDYATRRNNMRAVTEENIPSACASFPWTDVPPYHRMIPVVMNVCARP